MKLLNCFVKQLENCATKTPRRNILPRFSLAFSTGMGQLYLIRDLETTRLTLHWTYVKKKTNVKWPRGFGKEPLNIHGTLGPVLFEKFRLNYPLIPWSGKMQIWHRYCEQSCEVWSSLRVRRTGTKLLGEGMIQILLYKSIRYGYPKIWVLVREYIVPKTGGNATPSALSSSPMIGSLLN